MNHNNNNNTNVQFLESHLFKLQTTVIDAMEKRINNMELNLKTLRSENDKLKLENNNHINQRQQYSNLKKCVDCSHINIDRQNPDGWSPLIMASANINSGFNLEYVKSLIESGANIHLQTQYGDTCLTYLVRKSSSLELIKDVISRGASFTHLTRNIPKDNYQSNHNGNSLLHWCAIGIYEKTSSYEILKYLESLPIDKKLKNQDGKIYTDYLQKKLDDEIKTVNKETQQTLKDVNEYKNKLEKLTEARKKLLEVQATLLKKRIGVQCKIKQIQTETKQIQDETEQIQDETKQIQVETKQIQNETKQKKSRSLCGFNVYCNENLEKMSLDKSNRESYKIIARKWREEPDSVKQEYNNKAYFPSVEEPKKESMENSKEESLQNLKQQNLKQAYDNMIGEIMSNNELKQMIKNWESDSGIQFNCNDIFNETTKKLLETEANKQ